MSNIVANLRRDAVLLCAVILLSCGVAVTIAQAAEPHYPISFREIAPGVFVHDAKIAQVDATNRGDIANLGFVVGADAIAVIDTGASIAVGRALKAAVRRVSGLPIRYVINTHMHPDHGLGNAAFIDEKPAFVGHSKLARALAARAGRYLDINGRLIGPDAFAGTQVIGPTMGVETTLALDLGGRRLLLQAWPTAHTDNDLTVLDETTGTLFTGDLVFVEHIPTLDGSVTGWLEVLDRLERIPVRHIVPGHGPVQTSWPDALAGARRYLETLIRETRAQIAAGRTMSEAMTKVGLSEAGKWRLFDEYHARNVSAAFAELEWK
jgi:quinoprotein relay system zinc metallohydrolase 2